MTFILSMKFCVILTILHLKPSSSQKKIQELFLSLPYWYYSQKFMLCTITFLVCHHTYPWLCIKWSSGLVEEVNHEPSPKQSTSGNSKNNLLFNFFLKREKGIHLPCTAETVARKPLALPLESVMKNTVIMFLLLYTGSIRRSWFEHNLAITASKSHQNLKQCL